MTEQEKRQEELNEEISAEEAQDLEEAIDESLAAKQAEKAEAEESEPDAEEQDEKEAKIAELEAKVAELEDINLRKAAEFDNFRKRTRKEKLECYADAKTDVVKAILPIIDNLERAIESVGETSNEESKQMAEGVKMVHKQAMESLASIGVERIDAEGQPFDPELHEAVQMIEVEGVPENHIAKVLLTGYKTEDYVIRHSVVVVAQ